MPETNIENTVVTDLTNAITDFSVDQETTDAPGYEEDFTYQNENWSKQLGYYKKIPELRASIDAIANWTVGNGYEADEITTLILDRVKGNGKDIFNTILENQRRVAEIAGDSFAEIITNDENILINLKPLDPSTIRVHFNSKGQIKKYVQTTKVKGKSKEHTFKVGEIFHLSRNRTADEAHGISVVDSVEEIILMRNEAMTDWKKVLHRNVVPLRIIEIDSDDNTKIASMKADYQEAISKGEVLIIPKGNVEIKDGGIAPNATLNPLPWIEQLNSYYYQAVGVPDIIVGGSRALTEASAKIALLAYERTIRANQLDVEEQVLSQLNLEIKLQFPVSLMNELLSSVQPQKEQAVESNDLTTEVEGRK